MYQELYYYNIKMAYKALNIRNVSQLFLARTRI